MFSAPIILEYKLKIYMHAINQFSSKGLIIMSYSCRLNFSLSSICHRGNNLIRRSIFLQKAFVSIYQHCSCSSINTTSILYSLTCSIWLNMENLPGNYFISQDFFFHKEAVYVSFISFTGFYFPWALKQKHAQQSVTHRADSLHDCQ